MYLYFLAWESIVFLVYITDAVVITMYNTVTVFAGSDVIHLSEILMAIMSFLVVCSGGIFVGLFAGAISSLVSRSTTHVRGKREIE